MSSTVRIEVGKIDDLKDGTMKEVPFPSADSSSKILLSKIGGSYYATSNKCTHYGAPLVKGVLTAGGRVVCPWHGACFDVCSGDIEDAPGLNNLTSYKVETEGASVFVTGPSEADKVSVSRPPPSFAAASTSSGPGVVIIGGGSGGAYAVEQLRESGYAGKITVISQEGYLPVDRTKISKALITDPSKIALRSAEFYKDLAVEFKLSTEATSIDFATDTVSLSSGDKVAYDHLIVATGAIPNRIPVDGSKLENIFVVRSVSDAAAIDNALTAGEDDKSVVAKAVDSVVGSGKKNVVVVGSSFIGMEAAGALAKRASVTVLGMEDAPFKAILGEEVGNGIRQHHEKQGVKFLLPASLSHFTASESSPSYVGAVVLKDGTSLPADIVVLGVGVKPATAVLKASGIALEKDGGVRVDEHLRLNGIPKGNVYAIGDIAHYPDHATGVVTRVEHWNVASNHARSVARTISGSPEVFSKVAVFWSAQGQQLRYAGTGKAKSWKDVIVQGDPSALKFIAYYIVDDEVVAVASMQNDPIAAHVSELFSLGKMLTASEIKAGKNPFDVPLA